MTLYDGLQLLYDVRDCQVVFEVVFDVDSEQLRVRVLFESFGSVDVEVYLCWDWVEDGVVGFGGVWDEVVVVEVVDEVVEF